MTQGRDVVAKFSLTWVKLLRLHHHQAHVVINETGLSQSSPVTLSDQPELFNSRFVIPSPPQIRWDTAAMHSKRPFDVTVTTPPPPSRQRWRLPVLQSNDDGQPRGFELPRPSMATDTCPQHLDTFAGPWRESLRPSFAEVLRRCGGINTGGINTMYRSGSDYT
ncbi:hypothetical protein EDB89DRAFT_1913343 [Lactarius sanguifluus]|nr:hypothetical protein EDB89DRAFT_1913343 [Lactarius sanguifluus]